MNQKPVYFRLIDLSGVPVPDFVESLSFEEIRRDAIAQLVALDPAYTAILESDPAIKIIEAFSYRELLLRQRINDAARANTITEAVGNDLDVIGAFVNVDRLPGEADARFRIRVQQGLALLAAAGPRNAYRAHTMAVSTAIIDVGVHSPAPGEVAVTVLGYQEVEPADASTDERTIGAALFEQPLTGDVVRILNRADSALLNAVRVRLNADDIRPLTDAVTVQPPNVKLFQVTASLVIYPGPDGAAVVASATASLRRYLRSVRKVAYDATRSGIIAALHVPGVQNVVLTSPMADIEASFFDIAVCTAIDLTVERVDV